MKSSIQIHNEIQTLGEAIAKDSTAFNVATGDEQAAIHDRIVSNQGRMAALNEQLSDALKAEDEIRAQGGAPKVAEHAKPKVVDATTAFLGTRAEFDERGGIQSMYGAKFNLSGAVRNAADATHQFSLATPAKTDYTLPGNIIEMPMGVIDTLAKGTTDSDLTYMVQGEFTNNAALWSPGTVKPESDESWKSDTANLFWVAHHIPISRHTASHYGQLQSIISTELLTGLKIKEAAYALNLDDGSGKKGILKKTGVQKYAIGTAGAKKGENFYDSVRRAMYASWRATGLRPDYVAVHPLALVELDLKKLSDGQYMQLVINNKIWSLPVVEDINLEETADTTTKYGALVYNHNAATWYTSEADSLIMGYVNDQLTRNEYTLLAEGEHLFTVQRPASFVHIADAIGALA